MTITEKEIQEKYTHALMQQKNNKTKECCSSTAQSSTFTDSDVVLQTTTDSCCANSSLPDDELISFGCSRLDQILERTIQPGMTVIECGSGPGHDLLLAARYVGKNGKAIGVDFTDAMIKEAREKAASYGLTNVELVKSNIQNISLPDNIADIIISNCVINLALNKADVFREAFRILKPGGILIDADIITESDLPMEIKNNKESWCSCVGGALTADMYKDLNSNAGFQNIYIENISNYAEISDKAKIYSGIIYATKP